MLQEVFYPSLPVVLFGEELTERLGHSPEVTQCLTQDETVKMTFLVCLTS